MYITREEFAEYSPLEIPSDEFRVLASRASDVVDVLTLYAIESEGGVEALPLLDRVQVKKAVCAEVQYLYEQGGLDAFDYGSVSIGKFSASGAGVQRVSGLPVAPLVIPYLSKTGLTYRGR